VCLLIASLVGFRGMVPVEIVNVCGSLTWQALGTRSGGDRAGLRSGPEDQRSHGLQSTSSSGLWGRAWCAALAILLVYHGMEKPSTS
jgi:hypothetical protein